MSQPAPGHHDSLLTQSGPKLHVVCSLCLSHELEKCRDCNCRQRDATALHGPRAAGVEGRRERLRHALAHILPLITHLLGDDIALIICELFLSHLLSREMKGFIPLEEQEGDWGM